MGCICDPNKNGFDSKNYHRIEKSQPSYEKKRKKKKAGDFGFVGFLSKKQIKKIPYYFVLGGFASFTTSRTGYFASVSGTLYIVPVRIVAESVMAKSFGRATAMASPSFLP